MEKSVLKKVAASPIGNASSSLLLNIPQKQMGPFVGCQFDCTTHSPKSDAGSCLQRNGRIAGGPYISVVAVGYSVACKLGFITEHSMFHKPLMFYSTLSEIA